MTDQEPPINPIKALCLVSGSIDSTLAAQLVAKQGVELKGLCLITPFSVFAPETTAKLKTFYEKLGMELIVEDASTDCVDYLGAAHSPESDETAVRRAFLTFIIRKATEKLRPEGPRFIVTGETVRRRTKGYKRKDLKEIAGKSGARELLLRPLSAGMLSITAPERRRWVRRNLLGAISDESPIPRIAIAKDLGLDFFPPREAGNNPGDPKIAKKTWNYFETTPRQDQQAEDLRLVLSSRSFKLPGGSLLAVAKNRSESLLLKKHLLPNDKTMTVINGGPAFGLLRGPAFETDEKLAAGILLACASGQKHPLRIAFGRPPENTLCEIEAVPADKEAAQAWRL